MKKLELKHLAPYLPYGLKVQRISKLKDDDSSDIMIMGCYIMETIIDDLNPHWVGNPILRPLSDITKPIKVEGYNNGEEFVPVEYIGRFMSFSKKDWDELITDPENIIHFPYYVFDLLIKWHLDVFGLIPDGLAIDINTLNQ